MENGIQALLVAFAILIFIVALTVSLTSLNTAKKTADVVLRYSDRDYFQEYVKADEDAHLDGGRDVGIGTVITTLLRLKRTRENFAVRVINGGASEDLVFDYGIDGKAQLEQKIDNFVNDHVDDSASTVYRETYTEATLIGQTFTGQDGTTIEENVGKKIYITYTKK